MRTNSLLTCPRATCGTLLSNENKTAQKKQGNHAVMAWLPHRLVYSLASIIPDYPRGIGFRLRR